MNKICALFFDGRQSNHRWFLQFFSFEVWSQKFSQLALTVKYFFFTKNSAVRNVILKNQLSTLSTISDSVRCEDCFRGIKIQSIAAYIAASRCASTALENYHESNAACRLVTTNSELWLFSVFWSWTERKIDFSIETEKRTRDAFREKASLPHIEYTWRL